MPSGQNIRLSICQDRLGVGGVGVEHLMGILTREKLAVIFLRIGLFARNFQGLNRRLRPKLHPRLFVPSVLARFPD